MSGAVYIACPIDAVHRAVSAARMLRREQIHVVSLWHDIVSEGARDPVDRISRSDVLAANLRDMQDADVLLVDTVAGTPAATFAEVGYAVALGIPIVWRQSSDPSTDHVRRTCIFDAWPACKVVTWPEDVLPAIRKALERTQ